MTDYSDTRQENQHDPARALTQEQLDAIPEDTRVMVAWSGGTTDVRGPYLVARDRHGTYMMSEHQRGMSREIQDNIASNVSRITNAGRGRAQVHVWPLTTRTEESTR